MKSGCTSSDYSPNAQRRTLTFDVEAFVVTTCGHEIILSEMAVKSEKDLSETLRSLWLKAVAAIELRNFGYAISLLQEILKQEPRFLMGRELLRRAAVTKSKSAKRNFFNISTAPLSVMKAQQQIKKDPKRAVETLEKVLEAQPYNRQANLVLKEAALGAGWPEIAIFALRTLLEENPRDLKVLYELGRLYHDLGDSDQEVEVYNQISAINPFDAQALRLGKDASAHASMKGGGWTQAESYRDLIKDKEEAISLEQQSRLRLTGEALDQQIAEAYARHKAEPANVDVVRRLGALNEQKEDLQAAMGWYQCAADLTKGADTGLARKLSDLKIKRLEQEIAVHEEFLSTHDKATESYAKKSEQLKTAKARRAEILIDDALERVARNPTDLQLRFELGKNLFNAGRFREAVPELQRARQNPHTRLKAMNVLGCCYSELKMLDLAMKQLEEASKEIVLMDPMKKEIVYNLGLVHERMGEVEKSLACMKQIYEVDYGYRDVAQRVERSYGQNLPHA
jgi:tetratricopeptide (TPR) repeat protein